MRILQSARRTAIILAERYGVTTLHNGRVWSQKRTESVTQFFIKSRPYVETRRSMMGRRITHEVKELDLLEIMRSRNYKALAALPDFEQHETNLTVLWHEMFSKISKRNSSITLQKSDFSEASWEAFSQALEKAPYAKDFVSIN